ncbi:MAG: catalase [Solirubrobacteraceae bacterium]|nr:catalase [Solirubrobacteraceae bacterium]
MAVTPEDAVDRINERFGRHAGRRALHAKGLFCTGTFTATPEAARLTRAAHLQGTPVPVRARVSNGGGDPGVADYEPDVRGLAVKFDLPDGSSTDISSQSVPRFPVKSVEAFLEILKISKPSLGAAARFPLFAARHPGFVRALPANAPALKPTASYANVQFYAIHAYKWLDADGGSRWVRYEWRPEAGNSRIGVRAAKQLGRDYLQPEFRERLAAGPVRWTLSVQIAGPDDNPHDPSAHWPPDRQRIDAGTLELTEAIDDPEAAGNGPLVFDPGRITDGIELSDDPVLRFRPSAYSVSVDRRT